MAYPIRIIGTDLSPLVVDDDYEVVDKQQLAEWIAQLVLGEYGHVYMIIEKLAPEEMPSDNGSIDYMISRLVVPADNETLIDHRDGWLFQMMSWIALNIKLHQDYPGCPIHMVAPHDARAKHGIDGLAMVLTADNKIRRIVITEDKCTTNPRDFVRNKVLPEFKDYEKHIYDNKLKSELTQFVSPVNNRDLYIELSPSFANHDHWTYRIGITRESCHNTDKGRQGLFKGYDAVVIGDVERRKGASIYLTQMREWMQDLSERVVAILESKKQ